MRSVGKLIINRFDEKIIIGTTLDVTEDVLKKIVLRKKNKDLERNNKELIEFNYAASHDLQEPLRKIQTFISRINEKEKDNLSDTGKAYLERIVIASKRMRVLINVVRQFNCPPANGTFGFFPMLMPTLKKKTKRAIFFQPPITNNQKIISIFATN